MKATYGYDIALYRPQPRAVDAYVAQNGLNAFYDSVEMRRECCRIRKVEPLGRALAGNKAWITGQRRAQSATRAELAVQEDDPAHGMTKFNPLADWSEAGRLELHPRQRRAVQRAARPGLPVDRLRTLHARRAAGRGRPRRPLVVGEPGVEGMRPARGRRQTDSH